MFVPSAERRREIQQEARLYAQVFRIALNYVKADQGQTGRDLLKAVEKRLSKSRPEEAEWSMHQAIQRGKEIARRENEQAEEEIRQEIAAANHT
jgi:2-oxo-4-hydroxy-4-carboxy--5-ureidoimidazoline (OHCU) decarboxylase